MATVDKTNDIKIGGTLSTAASSNILVHADEVFDESWSDEGLSQDAINDELKTSIETTAAAALAAMTTVELEDGTSHLTLSSSEDSTTGATTYTIGESDIASASDLTAEIARAEAAEATLTSDLASEVSRATAAEEANATAISTETARAEAAEATLTSDLASEVSRATTAEETNASAISAETTRAEAAEEELSDAISALESSLSYEDSYTAGEFVGAVSITDNALSLTKKSISIVYDSSANTISLSDGTTTFSSMDASAFIVDGMIESVTYDSSTKSLNFVFNTDAGKTDISVDVSDLVDTYTAGVGLTVSNNEFSVVIDSASESFLTVSSSGVKLSGVQDAIDSASSDLSDSIAAVASDLADEVSRATAAEESLASDLADEVSRAEAAEATLTSDLASEVSRATAAEATLTSDLASEVSRATAAEESLADDLAVEVSRATAAEETNAANIATNATNIATNTTNISTNATNIAANTEAIEALQSTLDWYTVE